MLAGLGLLVGCWALLPPYSGPFLATDDTEQEKRGVSMRSATTSTSGRSGWATTAGELWASRPGRSALTKLFVRLAK